MKKYRFIALVALLLTSFLPTNPQMVGPNTIYLNDEKLVYMDNNQKLKFPLSRVWP